MIRFGTGVGKVRRQCIYRGRWPHFSQTMLAVTRRIWGDASCDEQQLSSEPEIIVVNLFASCLAQAAGVSPPRPFFGLTLG